MNEASAISCVSLESKASAAPRVVSANLGGEIALLDPECGTYFSLNDVGARIWELLESPRSLSEVREALLAEFEVDAIRCENDLVSLVEVLLERRLVTVVPDANA